MTPPETAPDHVARAQAIHADLARWKPVLERLGCAVTLDLVPDRTGAVVAFTVTVKGTLPEARKKTALLKATARLRGFELGGGIIELDRDGLAPDEWRICLCSVVLRAQRPKAA
jgi:hypothetical protein